MQRFRTWPAAQRTATVVTTLSAMRTDKNFHARLPVKVKEGDGCPTLARRDFVWLQTKNVPESKRSFRSTYESRVRGDGSGLVAGLAEV